MGAGIAVIFKKKFSGVQELLMQKKTTGDCAVLKRDGRFVYYLSLPPKRLNDHDYLKQQILLHTAVSSVVKGCQFQLWHIDPDHPVRGQIQGLVDLIQSWIYEVPFEKLATDSVLSRIDESLCDEMLWNSIHSDLQTRGGTKHLETMGLPKLNPDFHPASTDFQGHQHHK
ncbi:OARD1 deacetylase, partial [Polypterus senegalus]